MKYIKSATERIIWRGYRYRLDGKVSILPDQSDKAIISAEVFGQEGAIYDVKIHTDNPFDSTCTCPYASENNRICKHKIATYFSAYPAKYAEYIASLDRDSQWDVANDMINKVVLGMSDEALQDSIKEFRLPEEIHRDEIVELLANESPYELEYFFSYHCIFDDLPFLMDVYLNDIYGVEDDLEDD